VKRLLVLGAGPAQLGLLEAARRRRLHVIAVDRNPSAPGFRYADRRAIVSVEDEAAVDRLAVAERVDGVIAPGIDWPVVVAARIAERLGLPHPIDSRTAILATSKLKQREWFAAAGVPQPGYDVCRSLDEAAAAAERLGYPCVVKPPDRQGQRGLSVVREPAELGAAVDEAIRLARNGSALVEELVDGPEITVNAFSSGGRLHPLTVTDRLLGEPPAFGVALAHAWPPSLSPEAIGSAVEAVTAAADALRIGDGPTYTQLRIGRDGPRVGELAARLGGGHDAELCEAALGVDLNGLALAAALGEEIPDDALVPRERVAGACVRFLVAPPGELTAVHGLEDAADVNGVQWVRVYHERGHRYGALLRGADRAGAILATGSSRDGALARADEAVERIRFETMPAREAVAVDR
jgi:biotin carboxylase